MSLPVVCQSAGSVVACHKFSTGRSEHCFPAKVHITVRAAGIEGLHPGVSGGSARGRNSVGGQAARLEALSIGDGKAAHAAVFQEQVRAAALRAQRWRDVPRCRTPVRLTLSELSPTGGDDNVDRQPEAGGYKQTLKHVVSQIIMEKMAPIRS